MTRWRTPLARGGAAWPLALLAASYAAWAAGHESGYMLRVLALAGVNALAVLGYRFVFGLAGALSLAQAAFAGLGAYVAGVLAVRWGVPFGLALPAAVLAPVLPALAVGALVLRLRTHVFALATLLVARMALLVAVQWQAVTGGANGIGGVPPLPVGGRGAAALAVWACVALAAILAWAAGRGRLGGAYAMLRADPAAARAAGANTAALLLGAFVASAAYGGLAGALSAHVVGVVSPDVLGFPAMVAVLVAAVVGGRRRVSGAIAGAVLVTLLPEWVRVLRDESLLAFGVLLLAVVVAAPEGLVALADAALARLWVPPEARAPEAEAVAMAPGDGVVLEVRGVARRFGGVRALAGVSLAVRAGEVVGLIGPNGSGKSTLLNVVSGVYRPGAGGVWLRGARVDGVAGWRVARGGAARTFQSPVLAAGLSALDNVAWVAGSRAAAMGLLQRVGAGAVAWVPAEALPPGTARLVELARGLALRPAVLLLDEPAAGLTEAEQAALAAVLRGLAAEGLGLLVVEHSMAFLAAVADRLVCLDEGRVIASGLPGEVRADARVIAAYLG